VSGKAIHRWVAALLLQLSACSARCGDGGPSPSPVVVVQQRLVDARSGEVLGPLPPAPGLDSYGDRDAVPEPGEQGSYAIGPFVVATRRPWTRLRAGARMAREIDAVVFDEPTGARRWAFSLAGAPRVATGQDVAAVGDAVAVLLQSELLVLDAATGARRWSAPGRHEEMIGVGALVVTSDPAADVVAARRVTDGAEAFRLPFPGPVTSLRERQGHLVMLEWAGRHGATIVDGGGHVVLHLREAVADVQRLGEDWLVAGRWQLSRVSPGGQLRWALAPALEGDASDAAFVTVGADDTIVIQWDGGSDSGVGVARVTAAGVDRWRHVAEPLGVPHSEYYHQCYALLDGGALVVISQGSGGSFVERLDAATGSLLDRWRYHRRPGE